MCSSEVAFPLQPLSSLKILGGAPGFGHGRRKVVCNWLYGENTFALP